MLKTIKLTNLLSFGAETEISFNKGLNVLIGTNGSGKSNLIEVISLLQAMPKDIAKVISEGGGIAEWSWKGEEKHPIAKIEVVMQDPNCWQPLHHKLIFQTIMDYHIHIINEQVYDERYNETTGSFKKENF